MPATLVTSIKLRGIETKLGGLAYHPFTPRDPSLLSPALRSFLWGCVAVAFACFFSSLRAAERGSPPAGSKAEAKYNVDRWGVDHGLLYDTVGSILYGRDGYLWIGTDGGISRFDGVEFVSFRMDTVPGLVGDSVRCLTQDSTGAIWIGTNRGLSRYADGKFEIVMEATSTSYVYAVCEDAAGVIWIGTQFGLRRYHQGALQPVETDPLVARKAVSSLFVDSQRRLWIGMSGFAGVVRYDGGKFTALDHRGTIGAHVSAIQESPQGVLWFGTTGAGLVRYDSQANSFINYTVEQGLGGRNVTELFADGHGNMWIGALGLQRCDVDGGSIESVIPLSVTSMRRICRDAEGSIWAATYGDGLMRVRPARYKILNSAGGLPGDFVRTVMQDKSGAMWLSQSGEGIVRIAPDGLISRLVPATAEDQSIDVLAVYTTTAGVTFAGAQRATYVWQDGRMQRHPEQRGCRAFYEDSRGVLWAGVFERGVYTWKDGAFTRIQLPERVAKCTPCAFAEGKDGAMYVATTNLGLLRIQGDEVTWYNNSNGMPSEEVRCVSFDVDDNLWVGTKRGLVLRSAGRWFSPAWIREIVGEHVTGVVEIPGDYLLISTTRGVVRYNRKEVLAAIKADAKPASISQVNIAETAKTGSLGASCWPTLWRTMNGEIWFAARKGAVVIDPQKIRIDSNAPPVRIERLLADSRVHEADAAIELPAGTRQLTIKYTALTFVQPSRVLFRYQLEGYEQAPVDAGTRRVAFYNNLPPGNYVFRATACNSDGIWNETGAALGFTVLPFYYQTWWFRTAVGLAVAGLVLGVFRWRVRVVHQRARELQAQNAELERRIAERTAELAKSIEELQAAQRDLLESSRLAGMAEVATGVLHNIGNALNSVNVSADVARNRIRHMKAPSLERVAKLLQEQGDRIAEFVANDQRGRRLPEFLLQLSQHFSTECEATLRELEALCAGMDHIKTVVAAQQDFARGSDVVEKVEPAELIENALRINSGALTRHQVEIHRIFDPVPAVTIPRQKALQILVNLINNAKDAMGEAAHSRHQLRIGLRHVDEAFIEISVTDDGVGIPAENLTRIFNFGFTTKKRGHGFGLHSSALSARELGGDLQAFSEGAQRGATFVLRLPAKKAAVLNAGAEPAATPTKGQA